MRSPHLLAMSDAWLADHVETLERTIQRLRDEGTSRASRLIHRYGLMLNAARLEQIRRSDGD
jgi:hypothetical protein